MPLTHALVDTAPRATLERIVADNESLERECGMRAPNPRGTR